MTLEPRDKEMLLELAHLALRRAVTTGALPQAPQSLLERFREPRACFVTLEAENRLRGCIGHIFPQEPLAQAVIHNAAAAALNDSRFLPVTPEELPAVHLEVSVLTVPEPLDFKDPAELMRTLRPHIDGVLLELEGRRSTFLPQVWESLPDTEEFLNQLAVKAGRSAVDWRNPGASVMTYQVESFTDPLFHHRLE